MMLAMTNPFRNRPQATYISYDGVLGTPPDMYNCNRARMVDQNELNALTGSIKLEAGCGMRSEFPYHLVTL